MSVGKPLGHIPVIGGGPPHRTYSLNGPPRTVLGGQPSAELTHHE